MLVRELFDGGVDIIGDVHGEYDMLLALLKGLGYDSKGMHADGRRLVFVGDLTDRGPDSPAVVRLVRELVDVGRAQCVLGNHELNILRGERKQGNAWFFGERDRFKDGSETNEALADSRGRRETLELFSSLPLALERNDLRVVHACWMDEHVEGVRAVSEDLVSFSQAEVDRIDVQLAVERTAARAFVTQHRFDVLGNKPPPNSRLGALRTREQNDHPVKVMTSGIEEPADDPFWSGGRWRYEHRVPWWNDYVGPMVVVGHYWRSLDTSKPRTKGRDLFAGTEPRLPLGKGNVMCVDFSIGYRAQERHSGQPHATALAGYRWPEGELVFAH